MNGFLCSVADYYCNSGADLSGLTMVFPNKRAAMFMRMYFRQRLKGVGFMPRMVSISYFTQIFAGGSALAKPMEQIFTLYDSYRRVLTRHGREDEIRDFDSFIFRGEIILHDFEDVDAYMADTGMLFRNLRDTKEIASNYLTEAQLEVVRELWGTSPHLDLDRFWKHVGASDPEKPDDAAKAGFLSLWKIMGELYEEFTATLASHPVPLATAGGQSRRACYNIRKSGADEFAGQRFAFVGFNVLSTARTLIFDHLQKLGLADFFWDVTSPFIAPEKEGAGKYSESFNKAAKFIIPLSKRFPMPEGYEPPVSDRMPEIEIVSTPSNVGQAKTAGLILSNWLNDGILSVRQLLSTAVVLNNQSLLTPMLNSLAPEIEPVNVTMGLSYGNTPLAAFLSGIFRMHLRKGVRPGCYYFDDVNEVLSHPYVARIAPEEAEALRNIIRRDRLYNVPVADIRNAAPHLEFIFSPVDDADTESAVSFMRRLLGKISGALTGDAGTNRAQGYEAAVLQAYADAVEELCTYIDRFAVAMQKSTFFMTLERSLARHTISFSGKPIVGLQIMGMTDTRTLDFENVIILSMNERIFPKKSLRPSFLPENIRAGYALPTLDFEESTSAYQFYRLISRAKRVSLLYDNRTQDNISGEMSRYLYQLIYMPCGAKVTRRTVEIEPQQMPESNITVHKTDPEVVRALRAFRPDAAKKRYLSASALKTYLKCPLEFYLKYVRGLRDEDQPEAFINAASFGTIFHEMARTLYSRFKNGLIDAPAIGRMLASDLHGMALGMVSKFGYAGRYDGNVRAVPGEGQVLAKLIAVYIRAMLRAEQKSERPFTFVEAEMGESVKYEWKVNDKYTINFKMSVDRVDRLDADTLRFIDYKTGLDDTAAGSVAGLFSDSAKGGIFQLMTYCEAFADIHGYSGGIQPKLYKITELATNGVPGLRLCKRELTDYRDYHEEFRPMLEEYINRIFEENDEFPFVPTEDVSNCRFCFFKDMCGRYVEE